MKPSFTHIDANGLPEWSKDGLQYRLIAGEVGQYKSEVPVHSPLYLIEIKSNTGGKVKIGPDLFGESGLYILEGNVIEGGNKYSSKQILIAKDTMLCEIELEPNTTIYIFGGEPLPEKRYLYWNFVSSSREKIEKAKDEWTNQLMGQVLGEKEYVPLPPQPKNTRLKE